MRSKEERQKYNKEYFARPEVMAKAKERNAKYRKRRQEYKKTKQGKEAEKRYKQSPNFKEKSLWKRRFWRYGITKEDYEKILEAQSFVCAICGIKTEYKLHIDHNHETNKIRGLLCGNCNRGLGLFFDNKDFLRKAIEYLCR